MEWSNYILLGFLGGGLFFAVAAWAFRWAYKHGQLTDFDTGAKVIFDEEEPAGTAKDCFPPKRSKKGKGA